MTRRAAFAKAASLAPLVPLAAFADLKRAGDAELYKRADEGKLNAARAIERAKVGDLADGSSATCAELDALIAVDREAIEFEKDKVDARFGNDKDKVQATEDKLQKQVDKLKKVRKDKGCSTAGANLKQASDFEEDKLEALGSKADPKDVKIVADAEKAIEAQVKKLAGLQKTKGCK